MIESGESMQGTHYQGRGREAPQRWIHLLGPLKRMGIQTRYHK